MQSSDDHNRNIRYDLPGWEVIPGGFVLYVRIGRAWLNVSVLAQNFHRSPIALRTMQQNLVSLGSEDDNSEPWEYLEEIASPFLPVLQKLSPARQHVGRLTLADLYSRYYYKCQLAYIEEALVPSAITPMPPKEQDFLDEDYPIKEELFESPFPLFDTADVEIVYDDASTVFDTIHDKVLVHNQTMFWKPSFQLAETIRVVEKYTRIHKAGANSENLLISRFIGLVVDRRGVVCGHLYRWIDIELILGWEAVERTSRTTLEKWATQVQQTLSVLHSMDVVWGDVKAENVVIDKNGDAFIIDLEGGATKGWVDKDVIDTRAGDIQGLKRLMAYLLEEDNCLRTREKKWDLDYLESDKSDT